MHESTGGAGPKETTVAPPHKTNHKLQLTAFLLLLLFTALAAPSASRADYREPVSDDQGVYLLATSGDLFWFRETVNAGSADIKAKLTNDIDLSESGSPSHWTPIGQYTDATPDGYAGSFDGGGFTVSGYIVASADAVSMDKDGNLAAGFFGLVGQSAEIRSLTVSADISGSAKFLCAGGIVGYNYGTITNCTHSGGEVSASGGSGNNAGGIAGYNVGTITSNANSVGEVSASGGSIYNYAGGIAGYNSGTITDNANGGEVSASGGTFNNAGGIAGYNSGNGTITNCTHSGGEVSASGSSSSNCAGGIAGLNFGMITNNAHSGGKVSADGGSGSNYAGGIAGGNDGGTITNNAHSGGAVSASGGSIYNYAGGIAGDNNSGKITNCANSSGMVTASGGSYSYTGGIAGHNTKNGVNISNSCWPAGNLEAVSSGDKGMDAVSADVVSLDAAAMQRVVTTVLPVERSLFVALGGSAPALISYPGTADDMTGYFSVSGDISVTSPEIADISDRWPCTVSGIKQGTTMVSFDIDLRATDFSSLGSGPQPVAASCVSVPHRFTVTVGEEIPVAEVSLDLTELTLNIGESKTLTATVKPDDATYKAVAWISSNPAVAAVDDTGKVTALSAGTTVITAKAGEKSATCTVTVVKQKSGGSSHGCAAGLGALSMLTLIPLWLRRKR
ncbi:MAG: Ig-like domain-containing protein [Cloacibacillus porcorum]|uniref:Ig-like domain-containing protein n=1 Tax=Cloacibacillus porcorum TaxID=1197717 RepID=UPI002356131E|nr:Ig-like domain-containing protein [Cloacibacillus porcorum]MCI5863923.1 Ig-like domain-containing protein [Cloacibacillus porcorum]